MFNLIRKILALPLFARREEAVAASRIIQWWEMWRIPYNLFVGAAGVLCFIIIFVNIAIEENVFGSQNISFFLAIVAVPFYAIIANICFTSGWIVEIVVRKIWRERTGAFGEISFALGLVFSIFLTLAPAILSTVALVVKLLMGKTWA